jgi:hypothetical protein
MLERTLNVVGIVAGIPALLMVFWDGYWITGALLSLGWFALVYRYIQTRPLTDDGWLASWLVSAIFASRNLSRMVRARR